mmetsp:Transcript_35069/g.79021  ORF Transcript_35069/g.79021 Transcript_35069/m.79021 type:complete len:377 (+) Transcript_35069:52-1182(+)
MTEQARVNHSICFGEDVEIVNHFQEHGYVVVSQIFTEEEVDSAVSELWTSPRLLARCPHVRRSDPATWTSENWSQQDGGKNFLESLDVFQDTACWRLAENPKVSHVYDILMRSYGSNTGVMLARTPRWGVMRPAAKRREWRTEEAWLHWDQNPWTLPGFHQVQGFACLTEHTSSSGGFLCVPGFQKQWEQWGQYHPEGSVCVDGRAITREHGEANPFPVPSDDAAQKGVVRILAPKGSIILWDGRLPHQNYPNCSEDEFRIVLYFAFKQKSEELEAQRRDFLRRRFTVMYALGIQAWWPAGLSEHGRAISGAPTEGDLEAAKALLEENPKLSEAIRRTQLAGEDELRGELDASTAKLRSALKLFPEIESWHEVIFL